MNRPIISRDFDPEMAKEVGTDAAIIFENIWFWVNRNHTNNKHFYDGNYWTYNSKKSFRDLFSYITERKIRTCLDKLIKEKYLVTGSYNKNKYDRTLWYSIGQKWQMDWTKTSNGSAEIVQPIPDIKPNLKRVCVKKPTQNFSKEKIVVKIYSDITQDKFLNYCKEKGYNFHDSKQSLDKYTKYRISRGQWMEDYFMDFTNWLDKDWEDGKISGGKLDVQAALENYSGQLSEL